MKVIYVGLGGFIGVSLRYMICLFFPCEAGTFPVTTLVINFIGAFVIGLIAAYVAYIAPLNTNLTLFLSVGLCGGFSTLAALSLEAVELLENHKIIMGLSYAIISLTVCLLAIYISKLLVKYFAG